MKVKPSEHRLLVTQVTKQEKSEGGILFPDIDRHTRLRTVRIDSVGSLVKLAKDNNEGVRIGDHILVDAQSMKYELLNNQFIIEEEDIVATYED